jgi:RNA polymerase sigma factor (sigma-70 family)
MSEWTEAEKYLLEQIRRGSSEAWSQLVERFEGRLLAFARRRAPKGADAEDLVQDTFLLFLRGLPNYREQASLETYLFLILRRRIIELLRGKKSSACQLPESEEGRDDSSALAAPDPTASWYVRRDEHREAARLALTTALRSLVERMKDELNFRDLQVIELLFYAQWANRQIAQALQVDADHVALVKHRWLKQVRERVTQLLEHQLGRDEGSLNWDSPDAFDSLLTEIWEDQRLSCPKRSTIGGFLLNTLDAPWQQYVDFHLHRLGCSFCKANLDDLQKQTQVDRQAMRQRILQSTVGFFRKVPG